MSFNRKGELGWSINKISHRDNKQKNKSNKNNWGYNTFQAYLSYGSSLGVRQEKDLNVTKDSIEVKDLLSIPSFKSKLIKKFTFIDALVIYISMRSFDKVRGHIKQGKMIKIMCSCSKPGLLPTARLLLGVQLHLAPGRVGREDYYFLDYYSHEYFDFCTNGGWAD